MEIRKNRNTIIKLIGVRVCSIVNQQQIFQRPANNPQIFDKIPFIRNMAMLSVHSMVNKLSFGIKIVQDLVCIATMARCENHHLKFILKPMQKLNRSWSDVYPCLASLASWKFNHDFDVMRNAGWLVAVD